MSRTPLDDCFDQCERLTKRTAGNFYYSFLGLPTPQYRAMCVLYAFMRVTDDWGDETDQTIAQRIAALEAWRLSLNDALCPEWTPLEMTHWSDEARMVLPAMRDVAIRFAIPHEHLFAVIDGVRSDLFLTPAEITPSLRAGFRRLRNSISTAIWWPARSAFAAYTFGAFTATKRSVEQSTAALRFN